jgi:acyl carrier protein
MKIEEKLCKIVQAKLKIKKNTNININKMGLGINDNWDSLFHLSLLLEIEKKFNIKFTMTEMTEMITFSDILSKIKKYKR